MERRSHVIMQKLSFGCESTFFEIISLFFKYVLFIIQGSRILKDHNKTSVYTKLSHYSEYRLLLALLRSPKWLHVQDFERFSLARPWIPNRWTLFSLQTVGLLLHKDFWASHLTADCFLALNKPLGGISWPPFP
jgi:hypothetical protein